MTIKTFSAPLVGDYYRPPAKGIIQCLPAGHTLILRREPDNQYDENAVMVLVETSTFSDDMVELLDEKCGPFGFSADEIFAEPEWHLGYIAKEYAIHLTQLLIDENDEPVEYSAELNFTINEKGQNKPTVTISIDIEEN